MSANRTQIDCQISTLPGMAQGIAIVPPASLARRLKLMIRRRLSPRAERRFKENTNDLVNRLYRALGRETRPLEAVEPVSGVPLAAGDRVRVRSKVDIEATLNHWRQLKGCTFMPEMERYCETDQRVLKRLERFVDERDLRVKKSRGIVLLERVQCSGTAEFGPCDRSCFLFWREEWLERLAE